MIKKVLLGISMRCEVIPWYYGAAYREDFGRILVLYPVPINLIVRWARIAFHWMRIASKYELVDMNDLDKVIQDEANRIACKGRCHADGQR